MHRAAMPPERMFTRHHTAGQTASAALYSDCEAYRYSLTRIWDAAGPLINFVMLNPSTATEERNDPTIERCERRARALEAGGFEITNLFAFRATDPRDLRRAAHPNGPDNDAVLTAAAARATRIIAAWGVHGAHLNRAAEVTALLVQSPTPLYHMGLTKHGHPRHPLYLPYSQHPLPWRVNQA